MAFPPRFNLTVDLYAKDGFIGRKCPDAVCSLFFKVETSSLNQAVFCPYCGGQFTKEQLHTPDQSEQIQAVLKRDVTAAYRSELREGVKKSFSGTGWKFTQGDDPPPPPMPVQPPERDPDTVLSCPECACRFHVDGIFGYCPGCRAENLKLYDANWHLLKHELQRSGDPARGLRLAYSDAVSTFEVFCRKEAQARGSAARKFQSLRAVEREFADAFPSGILAGLTTDESLCVRRVVQKRHVFVHGEGVIDDDYVKVVPEDRSLLGKRASGSVEELDVGLTGLRKILLSLVQSRT